MHLRMDTVLDAYRNGKVHKLAAIICKAYCFPVLLHETFFSFCGCFANRFVHLTLVVYDNSGTTCTTTTVPRLHPPEWKDFAWNWYKKTRWWQSPVSRFHREGKLQNVHSMSWLRVCFVKVFNLNRTKTQDGFKDGHILSITSLARGVPLITLVCTKKNSRVAVQRSFWPAAPF
jgi:hypothetical protein